VLRATWLPVFQVKGMGPDLDLENFAKWTTHALRYTLIATLVCLPLRPLGISRWWMALSVGILFSMLASLVEQAIAYTQLPDAVVTVDSFMDKAPLLTGAKFCAAGLACWLLDLLVALCGLIWGWYRIFFPRVPSTAAGGGSNDPAE